MSSIITYLVLGAHVAYGVSLIDLLDLPDLSSYSIEFLLMLLDSRSDLIALSVVVLRLHKVHRFNFHLF